MIFTGQVHCLCTLPSIKGLVMKITIWRVHARRAMLYSRYRFLVAMPVVVASLVAGPLPANAASQNAFSANAQSELTVTQAEHALDIIQSQTNGTDGRFDCDRLVAAGVPQQIAVEYAGVLKAAGEVYTAPAAQQPAITKAATQFQASVDAVKHSRAAVTITDFDWGKVLRVLGSYTECLAARETLFFWYPFATCVMNPDGNGTWLVVMVPW
ncbi:hypothetical protein C5C66_00425 [Rathayibacter toxicus]|nr:hypothetical protein C5D15_00425 [Rathayibacter toxicus]PPH65337.1 hypothetical protein C5D13_00435 [Rathayibacter toxicus]PPH69502.1 hypothetical protein C5D01_00430 [Rathayibacter toxicus]PPH74372.1 hypothetical protein C5D24_00425 [Rathayibacter toxicus]PPH83726.1 hypothetical protein C5D20_00430 [Rathayibacter toxicus]